MKENRPTEVDYTTPLEGFKLNNGSHPQNYKVDWLLLDKEGEILEREHNRICFSNLQTKITQLMAIKNIPHTIQYDSKIYVPVDTAIRFMELGRENGLFPIDGDIEEAAKTGTVKFTIGNISQNKVYWFLCYFRYLRDDSFKVKSIVKLVDEYRVGFWPAFFYVVCNLSSSDGHNFIPISSYGVSEVDSLRVKAVYIHKLYKILTKKESNPEKNYLSEWTYTWNIEIFNAKTIVDNPAWGSSCGYYGSYNDPSKWDSKIFFHTQSFLHPLFAEFLALEEPQGNRAQQICKELCDRINIYKTAASSTNKEKKNGENLLLRCV